MTGLAHQSVPLAGISYRFHQPDLEADLNDSLSRRETVQVIRRCAVADHGDDDGVSVNFTKEGTDAQIRAHFVIGADGARSVVRRSFDCAWEDLVFGNAGICRCKADSRKVRSR